MFSLDVSTLKLLLSFFSVLSSSYDLLVINCELLLYLSIFKLTLLIIELSIPLKLYFPEISLYSSSFKQTFAAGLFASILQRLG